MVKSTTGVTLGPDPCSERTVSTGLDPATDQHRNGAPTPGTGQAGRRNTVWG